MSNRLPLGILISGRGSNMVAIAEAIQNGTLEAVIRVVVSNKAGVPGLEKAQAMGLRSEVVQLEDFPSKADYERKIAGIFKGQGVKLLCLAGYMRLLGPDLLSAFPGQIINIHPSLLPAFKGLHAQRQALEYGVKIAGATVHRVDESLDGGPILMQRTVPVLPDDTEDSLSARILAEEHRLYPEAIQQLVDDQK